MNRQRRSEAGYTLTEMLTVVAMIGVLALVAVPAFLTFYQSNKVKSSVRNFVSDIRETRQIAIANDSAAKLSFKTGANGTRAYTLMQGQGGTPFNPASYVAIPNRPTAKYLDDVVYFPANTTGTPQTFTDVDNDGDLDIICYPDGRVAMPTVNGTVQSTGTITVKTDMKVYKTLYTISISPSGRISVQ